MTLEHGAEDSLAGTRLRDARARLGISQARVGQLIDADEGLVGDLEQGSAHAQERISECVDALAALGPGSAYCQGWPVTLASTAAALRADLLARVEEADMLRVVIGAADDFARLDSAEDRWFFLARPGPTSSPQWDALLGALAVHLCRQGGLDRTPAWTRDPTRYLLRTWWVGAAGQVPSLRALALRDSPSSFRARGVMLSREVLASA